jgi:phage baseplate assembly protein W
MANPSIDPYGVDLAIDPSGDLRVTASGSLGMVAGPDNCAQAVFLRLKTSVGELALHPNYGSQMDDLVGSKQNPAGLLAAMNSDLRSIVSDDPRFVTAKIIQVQAPAVSGQVGSTQLGVQAQLFGGERVTLENTSDPSPSDVTLPTPSDPSLDPTLTWDPTSEREFFADGSELDTLNNLNTVQSMIDDYPPTGGIA